MMVYRTNPNIARDDERPALPLNLSDRCFDAMKRHAAAMGGSAPPPGNPKPPPPPVTKQGTPGDVIYGARAIAKFIFDDDSNRARRRVFNLWTYYSSRKERAGFFKLKGALCLSKSQWLAFHGLG